MLRSFLTACLLSAVSLPVMAAPTSIDQIYAFGDSLSDNGAGYGVTQMLAAQGVDEAEARPEKPYWHKRWSNGPVAVEAMAYELDVPLNNYAIGGAKTDKSNYEPWMDEGRDTGVAAQVDEYLQNRSVKGQANSKSLYFLMAAANDLSAHLGSKDGKSVNDAATQSADNMAANIKKLAEAGARKFLIAGAPDMSAAPTFDKDEDRKAAVLFQQHYDKRLHDKMDELASRYHLQVAWFDLAGYMKEIRENNSKYGFKYLNTACQPMTPEAGKQCDDPDQYFFWDEFHPTRHTHWLIGEAMAKLVKKEYGQTDQDQKQFKSDDNNKADDAEQKDKAE